MGVANPFKNAHSFLTGAFKISLTEVEWRYECQPIAPAGHSALLGCEFPSVDWRWVVAHLSSARAGSALCLLQTGWWVVVHALHDRKVLGIRYLSTKLFHIYTGSVTINRT